MVPADSVLLGLASGRPSPRRSFSAVNGLDALGRGISGCCSGIRPREAAQVPCRLCIELDAATLHRRFSGDGIRLRLAYFRPFVRRYPSAPSSPATASAAQIFQIVYMPDGCLPGVESSSPCPCGYTFTPTAVDIGLEGEVQALAFPDLLSCIAVRLPTVNAPYRVSRLYVIRCGLTAPARAAGSCPARNPRNCPRTIRHGCRPRRRGCASPGGRGTCGRG